MEVVAKLGREGTYFSLSRDCRYSIPLCMLSGAPRPHRAGPHHHSGPNLVPSKFQVLTRINIRHHEKALSIVLIAPQWLLLSVSSLGSVTATWIEISFTTLFTLRLPLEVGSKDTMLMVFSPYRSCRSDFFWSIFKKKKNLF